MVIPASSWLSFASLEDSMLSHALYSLIVLTVSKGSQGECILQWRISRVDLESPRYYALTKDVAYNVIYCSYEFWSDCMTVCYFLNLAGFL